MYRVWIQGCIIICLLSTQLRARENQSWIPFALRTLWPLTDSIHDTNRVNVDTARINRFRYDITLYYDFYTTLTGLHNYNIIQLTEPNNAYLYYNLDVKNAIKFFNTTWDCYLFNDYGLRHFFDSVTLKTQDQFIFKNTISFPIWKESIKVSLQSNTQTTLFNTHKFRETSNGEQQRYLYDGYMSPGTIMYSGGITYELKSNGTVHLGLGSSKITKIRKQRIFNTRETDDIVGLQKGQKRKSEFGMVCTATIPVKNFGKRWYWEFYGNVFTPLGSIHKPTTYTLDINNVFHLTLLNYVRLSWRCKLQYHPEESKKIGAVNQLSLGFYLNNHL